jgi:prepilin-type N-terminal cleavage/methylation domain-containing protein
MTARGRGWTYRAAGGWTLVEMLVALAVISTFLAGVCTAFIQIMKISDRSERVIVAHENARSAVQEIAHQVKAAYLFPAGDDQYFLGVNQPLLTGDRIDNDDDARIDEEQPNGLDDDHDWVLARDDLHAPIGNTFERARFRGVPDLGDGRVDEDVAFQNDQLSFFVLPEPSRPDRRDHVTYGLGTFEGESHVLLKSTTRSDMPSSAALTAPLAHDVVSVNFLYWDANAQPPYWVQEWNAEAMDPSQTIPLPAAVLIAVTVYAGDKPLNELGPNEPIETVTASTVVDIETILHDPRYEQIVRANQ